jgi:DNA topoisomerase-1
MNIKWGKHGEFLACSLYPECKNTKNFKRGENDEIIVEKINEICEVCGRQMVKKRGRYGEFLACEGYPECDNKRPVLLEKSGEICDKCGGELLIKRSKNGTRFLACINYPKCKNTKPLSTNVKCPMKECDGELIEKVSKRGIFYGCSKYPKCKFAIPYKPVPVKCPVCGFPFMIERNRGKECFNKECKYRERG